MYWILIIHGNKSKYSLANSPDFWFQADLPISSSLPWSMPATQLTGLSHFRLNQIPETYQQKRLEFQAPCIYLISYGSQRQQKNRSFFFRIISRHLFESITSFIWPLYKSSGVLLLLPGLFRNKFTSAASKPWWCWAMTSAVVII